MSERREMRASPHGSIADSVSRASAEAPLNGGYSVVAEHNVSPLMCTQELERNLRRMRTSQVLFRVHNASQRHGKKKKNNANIDRHMIVIAFVMLYLPNR